MLSLIAAAPPLDTGALETVLPGRPARRTKRASNVVFAAGWLLLSACSTVTVYTVPKSLRVAPAPAKMGAEIPAEVARLVGRGRTPSNHAVIVVGSNEPVCALLRRGPSDTSPGVCPGPLRSVVDAPPGEALVEVVGEGKGGALLHLQVQANELHVLHVTLGRAGFGSQGAWALAIIGTMASAWAVYRGVSGDRDILWSTGGGVLLGGLGVSALVELYAGRVPTVDRHDAYRLPTPR